MSTTYNGVASNVSLGSGVSITEKQDGDIVNAASDTAAEQKLADYVEALMESNALSALCAQNSFTSPGAAQHAIGTGLTASPSTAGIVIAGASGNIYESVSAGAPFQTKSAGVGTATLNGLATNGSLLVAVGNINGSNPAISTSPDGGTWTSRANTATSALQAVCWAPSLSLWCAVGASGLILTSPDGITWTSRTGAAGTLVSVAFGNGIFVAAQGSTQAYTSTNGTTWSSLTLPFGLGGYITSLIFSTVLNLFVACDGNGGIWTSSNGTTWTRQYNGNSAFGPISVAQVGRILVGINALSPLVTSVDGVNWKQRTFLAVGGNTPGPVACAGAANTLIMLASGGTAHTISDPLITP